MPPEICPCCGTEVPPNAKACPQCGADEQTGWSEEARADELGLPDENFDYNEFVNREFGGEKKSPVPSGIHRFWWIVAILILCATLFAFIFALLR